MVNLLGLLGLLGTFEDDSCTAPEISAREKEKGGERGRGGEGERR
jgi:hypothetical protein